MKLRKSKRAFFILFIIVFLVYLFYDSNETHEPDLSSEAAIAREDLEKKELSKCESSKKECLMLYDKLLNPDKSLIFRPPLKSPPEELLNSFTQNGDMPIKNYWYLDEAYSDAAASDNGMGGEVVVIKKAELDKWRDKVKVHAPLEYQDLNMMDSMFKHQNKLANKTMVVVGTRETWIEAISLEVEASKVYTLEYTHRKYEQSKLEWIHVNDYLARAIKFETIEEFDNACSFSSIEHSGLGRYGGWYF